MSASVSDHQKNRGQGNLGKPFNSKLPNGPKEHHSDRDELDSWRNQPPQHHQGYSTGMGGATADPYMPYYGSFQYPTGPSYGVSDQGPWSNGGGDMAFVGGGYSGGGLHDPPPPPPTAHYNSMEGGLFGGGNGGGFGNFGAHPGFGYGFHGNGSGGDYNAWGQPRKPAYDDYYRSRDGMKMLDGMSGLSLGDKEHSFKEMKEMMGGGGGSKKTWATIASQPAKPQSLMKKKAGMGGMPPPPIMLGTWEKNGSSVPKAPIAAPVQAPNPPVWERTDRIPPKMPLPGPPPPPVQNHPPVFGGIQSAASSSGRGGSSGYQGSQMNYNSMPPPPPRQPSPQIQQSHAQHTPNPSSNHVSHVTPAPPTTTEKQSPASPQYPDEAKIKSDYNPADFDLTAEDARFFVIKSYSEDDIHRSIKYEIWCSTDHGNKRLDVAWREREGKGPIYLFYSVNASGHFCGMAQMMSGVDHEASSSVWCQDKWKGQFKVKWIYVKDVPNIALRNIRLENNENKPVTNSRDTQEVPHDKGKQVLKILHSYQHTTSIFDDFIHYEIRQEEEDQRRTLVPSAYPSQDRGDHRGERGRGRGGFQQGPARNDHQQPRDRPDFGGHNRDNQREQHPREERSHQNSHGGGRGGGMRIGEGYDRDNFGGRSGGFDRNGGGGGDRDFYRDRGDQHRGGGGGGIGRGGSRPSPRN